MGSLTLVKCTLPHVRGQMLSGVAGLYYVDPTTKLLHLCEDQTPSDEAGCDQVDADRLRQISGFIVVKQRKPPAPRKEPAPIVASVSANPDPEPEPEPEPEATIDLSVLDQSVSALRRALASGDFDGVLADLLAAEEAGKTRKSAVTVITERISRGS